jgi:hypothetical protein
MDYKDDLILDFLGYHYVYDYEADYSYCGGLYSNIRCFSKKELKLDGGKSPIFDEGVKDIFLIYTGGFPCELKNKLNFDSDWNLLLQVCSKIKEVCPENVNQIKFNNFDIQETFDSIINILETKAENDKLLNKQKKCLHTHRKSRIKYYNQFGETEGWIVECLDCNLIISDL